MNLTSIHGIGKTSLDLLEATGFHDVESLANANVDQLHGELERANAVLNIANRAPTRASVEKWIGMARDIVGEEEAAGAGEMAGEPTLQPVNYEQTQEVSSMLSTAPYALSLPARMLMENGLAVTDIPAGLLLNRYSGDLDVRVERRLPSSRHAKLAPATGYVRRGEQTGPRQELDRTKIRALDEVPELPLKTPAARPSHEDDRIALLRAPRTTTNEGRDPNSRWYIRGVLHFHPISIAVGAAVTLLVMVMIPLSVISAALLFLSSEMPEHFSWVPGWLLALPVALPLFGIIYLIWGVTGSCQICRQKLFVHRGHMKNPKAHHVKGLGYILPLCFQILVFRWFRCTHCGTPVRLKK